MDTPAPVVPVSSFIQKISAGLFGSMLLCGIGFGFPIVIGATGQVTTPLQALIVGWIGWFFALMVPIMLVGQADASGFNLGVLVGNLINGVAKPLEALVLAPVLMVGTWLGMHLAELLRILVKAPENPAGTAIGTPVMKPGIDPWMVGVVDGVLLLIFVWAAVCVLAKHSRFIALAPLVLPMLLASLITLGGLLVGTGAVNPNRAGMPLFITYLQTGAHNHWFYWTVVPLAISVAGGVLGKFFSQPSGFEPLIDPATDPIPAVTPVPAPLMAHNSPTVVLPTTSP